MDWEFDDTLKMTYNNPVFLEQCKRKQREVDNSGFVEQFPLDAKEKLLVEEVTDEDAADEDDFDDDFDDEDSLFTSAPKLHKATTDKSSAKNTVSQKSDNDLVDDLVDDLFSNDNLDTDSIKQKMQTTLKIGGQKVAIDNNNNESNTTSSNTAPNGRTLIPIPSFSADDDIPSNIDASATKNTENSSEQSTTKPKLKIKLNLKNVPPNNNGDGTS